MRRKTFDVLATSVGLVLAVILLVSAVLPFLVRPPKAPTDH